MMANLQTFVESFSAGKIGILVPTAVSQLFKVKFPLFFTKDKVMKNNDHCDKMKH